MPVNADSEKTFTDLGRPGFQRQGFPLELSTSSPLLNRRRGQRRPDSSVLKVNTTLGKPSPSGAADDDDKQERLRREYEIMEAVGQGTTSVVSRAVRRSDGRQVALKTLRSDDPEILSHASKEFELLRQLKHPNIIQALECITFTGHATLIMDYFPGSELLEAVHRQPQKHLPEVVVGPLVSALLQAVDYLHQHRIVHRDIKPQNILVSLNLDDLRLVDFNTAHCLREGRPLTPTGTEIYAAPEVVQGESPSEQSDIWSVGLCAYFMLCGNLPQRRTHAASSRSVLRKRAATPVAFDHPEWCYMSDSCKTMLSRCLALRPSERPAPMTLLQDAWLQSDASVQSSVNLSDGLQRLPQSNFQRAVTIQAGQGWAHATGDCDGNHSDSDGLSAIAEGAEEEDICSPLGKLVSPPSTQSSLSTANLPGEMAADELVYQIFHKDKIPVDCPLDVEKLKSEQTENGDNACHYGDRHPGCWLEPSSHVEVLLEPSLDRSSTTALAKILTVDRHKATYKVLLVHCNEIQTVKVDRVIPLSPEAATLWEQVLKAQLVDRYKRRKERRSEMKLKGITANTRNRFSSW